VTDRLTQATTQSGSQDGAWGVRFPSLAKAAGHVLVEATEWAPVTLDLRLNTKPEIQDGYWSPKGTYIPLASGGLVEISWPHSVRLTVPTNPKPEFVIQPHLATAAACMAVHTGRQAFHAGAVIINGGAWAIFGAKEAGKSSTLGRLHQMGIGVLTDDVLVCDGLDALVGPRCIDLRIGPAKRLAIGQDFGVVGLRERWRVYLPSCPNSVPLHGWVLLDWADEDRITPLAATDRLSLLDRNQALQLPAHDAAAFLQLSALPAYRWSRRKSWERLDDSIKRFIDAIS
jgi:hypothetical protein